MDGDAALAAAITQSLRDDDTSGFGEVFDVECMGREIVVGLGGASRAEQKYGITPKAVIEEGQVLDEIEVDRADAEAVLAGYERCGDFDDLLRVTFESNGADEEFARCVVEAMPDDAMREAILEDFTGTGERDGPAEVQLDEALAVAAAQCDN